MKTLRSVGPLDDTLFRQPMAAAMMAAAMRAWHSQRVVAQCQWAVPGWMRIDSDRTRCPLSGPGNGHTLSGHRLGDATKRKPGLLASAHIAPSNAGLSHPTAGSWHTFTSALYAPGDLRARSVPCAHAAVSGARACAAPIRLAPAGAG